MLLLIFFCYISYCDLRPLSERAVPTVPRRRHSHIMTIWQVIIAIQWASLAGGDQVKWFFNRTLHCTFVLVMECAANIDGDSGRGPWPNLRTMFEFKGKTDNIVKLSCLLCLPKKNVSAFANYPSNLWQHIKVRMESYPFHAIVLHGF